MIKTLLTLLVLVSLTGCLGTVQPVVVVRTEVIAPDDDLLVNCPLQEPPEPYTYRTSNADEKELMLTRAYTGSTGKLVSCNARWAALRKWKADQKAAIAKKNAEADAKAKAAR